MFDKYNSPYYLWCQKVLPLVYDDSLSYYETICKLINVVNEVIEKIQENDETRYQYVDEAILSVEKRCKDYSDNNINKLLSQVIAITNAIYSYINGEDMLIKNKYDKELIGLFENECGVISSNNSFRNPKMYESDIENLSLAIGLAFQKGRVDNFLFANSVDGKTIVNQLLTDI